MSALVHEAYELAVQSVREGAQRVVQEDIYSGNTGSQARRKAAGLLIDALSAATSAGVFDGTGVDRPGRRAAARQFLDALEAAQSVGAVPGKLGLVRPVETEKNKGQNGAAS